MNAAVATGAAGRESEIVSLGAGERLLPAAGVNGSELFEAMPGAGSDSG